MSNSDNSGHRDFSRFERLSNEELRSILARDSLLDDGEDADMDSILAISEILAGREHTSASEIDAAWESFQKDYRPYTMDAKPLFALDDDKEEPHLVERKKTRLLVRIVSIAAVISLLLGFGAVTAYARKGALWNVVVNWSQGSFRLADPDEPKPGPFYALATALRGYGIREPLVPKWLPDGYGEGTFQFEDTPGFMHFFSACFNGEKEIHMNVFHYSSEQRPEVIYESDTSVPYEIYEAGGVEHYLMMNDKYRRAVWMNGDLECSILGEVSEQEMKRIIDSIYK